MNKPSTKLNTVFMTVLYILSAALFIYGIYMAVYSLEYISIYQSSSAIALESSVQYVVTSTVTYFGFAFLLFAGALCLRSLSKIQKAVYSSRNEGHEDFRRSSSEEISEEISEPEMTDETLPDMSKIFFDIGSGKKNDASCPKNSCDVPAHTPGSNRKSSDAIEPESDETPDCEDTAAAEPEAESSLLVFEADEEETPDIIPESDAAPDFDEEIHFEQIEEKIDNTEASPIEKTEHTDEHKTAYEPVKYHEKISSSVIKDIFENK